MVALYFIALPAAPAHAAGVEVYDWEAEAIDPDQPPAGTCDVDEEVGALPSVFLLSPWIATSYEDGSLLVEGSPGGALWYGVTGDLRQEVGTLGMNPSAWGFGWTEAAEDPVEDLEIRSTVVSCTVGQTSTVEGDLPPTGSSWSLVWGTEDEKTTAAPYHLKVVVSEDGEVEDAYLDCYSAPFAWGSSITATITWISEG